MKLYLVCDEEVSEDGLWGYYSLENTESDVIGSKRFSGLYFNARIFRTASKAKAQANRFKRHGVPCRVSVLNCIETNEVV